MLRSREEIIQWLDHYGIKKITLTQELIVNVEESVDLSSKNLTHLPIQFGYIMGDFDISGNQLLGLKGCPHTVHGCFNASINKLKTLKYTPKKVYGIYNVSSNEIAHLNYFPQVIDGSIYLTSNKLKELKNLPKKMIGHIDVSYNQLLTLKGVPDTITGELWAADNQLKNLEHVGSCYSLYVFNNPLNEISAQDLPDVQNIIDIHNTQIPSLTDVDDDFVWTMNIQTLKTYLLYHGLKTKLPEISQTAPRIKI